MKKYLLAFSLVLAIPSFAAVKIGVVNVQQVLVSINEGKAVMSTLEKSFKKKQKELKTKEDEIKKMQEDFQKQNMVLSDAAKAKKQQEIGLKIQTLQKIHMEYQKDIQQQEAELKKPILEKLKPIIDDVSKEEAVALTFEVQSSPLVYAETSVDITEKVIKAYDKKNK